MKIIPLKILRFRRLNIPPRTEVLLESSMQMKPAAEGIGIPYKTQSTKSRGQSTSHQLSAFKTTPTLLTKYAPLSDLSILRHSISRNECIWTNMVFRIP